MICRLLAGLATGAEITSSNHITANDLKKVRPEFDANPDQWEPYFIQMPPKTLADLPPNAQRRAQAIAENYLNKNKPIEGDKTQWIKELMKMLGTHQKDNGTYAARIITKVYLAHKLSATVDAQHAPDVRTQSGWKAGSAETHPQP